MTDLIRDNATHWRQLCQTAYFELEPGTLLRCVLEARSAVLDRIEDILSRPITREQDELRNALKTLSTLQELAEGDIAELKKTSSNIFGTLICPAMRPAAPSGRLLLRFRRNSERVVTSTRQVAGGSDVGYSRDGL
jgi:hypothetical protein